MSDVNDDVVIDPKVDDDKTKSTDKAEDYESLKKKFEELEGKHEFAVSESKKNATKYKELRDELDAKEKKKLEEDGETDKLLDLEKKKTENLERRLLHENLIGQVNKQAKDCHDINLVIKTKTFQEIVKKSEDGLSFDEVDKAVLAVREEHPYLFIQTDVDPTVKKKPGYKSQDDNKKSTAELLYGE